MTVSRSTNPLSNRKEFFRLWFEYYKLALKSADPKLKADIKKSKQLYERWGDISTTFDKWWKLHAWLFIENELVRVVTDAAEKRLTDSLLVEIPLNQSTSNLLKQVKTLIEDEYEGRGRRKGKGNKQPTTPFRASEGSEPKLRALRDSLNVYSNVYLKNTKLRGKDLLNATHAFYRSRKYKQGQKIPPQFVAAQNNSELALRNLRRSIQKAEKIISNVARGTFPGRY